MLRSETGSKRTFHSHHLALTLSFACPFEGLLGRFPGGGGGGGPPIPPGGGGGGGGGGIPSRHAIKENQEKTNGYFTQAFVTRKRSQFGHWVRGCKMDRS